jgi:penicillin-binding protein 2
MKVITTRLISSKKIKGTAIDPKFKVKHQTSIDKEYFKPMIKGLFDVYNLGTKHIKVEGIDIAGKQVQRKILPN